MCGLAILRYNIPGVGRFVSADTIVPDAGNPQAFKRPGYVFNHKNCLAGHQLGATVKKRLMFAKSVIKSHANGSPNGQNPDMVIHDKKVIRWNRDDALHLTGNILSPGEKEM